MWDNGVFDRAFDSAGMRQRVIRLINGAPAGECKARFDRPQVIRDETGFPIHTTNYSLEYTTTDLPTPLAFDDEVDVEVKSGVFERYRVNQVPLVQGDGHWTRVELELVR